MNDKLNEMHEHSILIYNFIYVISFQLKFGTTDEQPSLSP